MGCGQSTDNKYSEQNKQGIYPPEQIQEVLELVWEEHNTQLLDKVDGELGKEIVMEAIKRLGEASKSERSIDEDTFQNESKKYKGWGSMKLTQDQLHDLVTKQMVPITESDA